jgi:type I restriction enzyme S subunit
VELKPGYQQTDLGVIPLDWEVKQIGDFEPFVTSGSRSWARFYSERGSPFIRITNLSRKCIYLDLHDLRFVKLAETDAEAARTQLRDGDILISITADIGIVGHVTANLPTPAYINQHIALVRFDSTRISSRFVSYFLASEMPQKLFRALTDSGAKAGMNLATVKQIRIALPPTRTEQEAIAEALTDTDALVDSLDQLFAKKRDLKQVVMQQLLSGQRRLPGFNGTWDRRQLGSEIVGLDAGVSVNSLNDDSGLDSDGPAILKTSAVENGVFVKNECKRIAPSDVERARLNPCADSILISRMNTIDLVGECGYVDADYPRLFVPDRLWMTRFRPDSSICAKWLSYVLSSREYRLMLRAVATGTSGSMKNISKDSLLSLSITLPSGEEQRAIASVLSDIDAEIAALERRRVKTRALKQGMMQELLTGKTRLV